MRIRALLIALLLWTSSPAFSKTLGLGIILGDPTGLTGKIWMEPNKTAVDFGIAYSFGDYLLLYADYLYHFPHAFNSVKNKDKFLTHLTPYVGIGVVTLILTTSTYDPNRRYFYTSNSSFGAGVRIPLGVEWTPEEVPLGVFLELAPGIGFIPRTYGIIEGGVGVRYYF